LPNAGKEAAKRLTKTENDLSLLVAGQEFVSFEW